MVAWLLATSGLRWWRQIAAQPRALWMLAGSSVAIAFNWGLYIWAINAGHVIEASLGYFINPLLSVLLGVLVLKERLQRIQWVAVVCATLGVLWLTLDAGAPPWIALGLAFSFGAYGLLRKLVAVDPVAGLGVESVYLFVPALLLAGWGEQGHGGAFLSGWELRTDLLLIFGGVVTAVPLIGFAYGVRRIPLSLVGILQYIGPSLQLLLGVWFFHEPFDQGRAIDLRRSGWGCCYSLATACCVRGGRLWWFLSIGRARSGSLPLYGSRLDAGDCRTTALRAVRAQSLLDIGMSFVNAGQERAVRSH